jgi:hypothetical protein
MLVVGAAQMVLPGSRRPGGIVVAASPAVADGPATSTLESLASLAATVTLRVESEPPGGTLRLADAELPLPAQLEHTRGTILDAVLEKPGYERQAVRLVFSESATTVVALKELPAPVKSPQVGKKQSGGDDYERKQIYLRPGESQAK